MTLPEKPRNLFERGPYVQLAALCERVLQEPDGVLSLIRVVDVITHSEHRPDAPPDMPEFRYPLTMAISLKAGTVRGRHELTIVPELPSGEALLPMTTSVRFDGDARGINVISRTDIPFKLEGLYWFTIRFDEAVLTRVPLDVRYSRVTTSSTS